MKKPSIVVVGSSNTDMVVRADRLPGPGETILGGSFFMNPGGKGANQAVAAARLGGTVSMIAKMGDDLFGRRSVDLLAQEGIDTSCVITDREHPSGIALITVDRHGENCIVVAQGSNAALLPADLEPYAKVMQQADVILLQLEIPLETVGYVVDRASAAQVRVILNPAPACALPESLLQKITLITPNITEASMLTGMDIRDENDAREAALRLNGKGVATVIITMGASGALLLHDNECIQVPAIPVAAVDSTAAGDVFNGALAVALADKQSLPDAVGFACRAAALSVTRLGAQSSAPYRHELQ